MRKKPRRKTRPPGARASTHRRRAAPSTPSAPAPTPEARVIDEDGFERIEGGDSISIVGATADSEPERLDPEKMQALFEEMREDGTLPDIDAFQDALARVLKRRGIIAPDAEVPRVKRSTTDPKGWD